MERKPSVKKEEEKKFGMTAEQRTVVSIAVGAILFILMEVLEHVNMDMTVLLPFYIIAYSSSWMESCSDRCPQHGKRPDL